jgi:hypothetical protein
LLEKTFTFAPGASASSSHRLCVDGAKRTHTLAAIVEGEARGFVEHTIESAGQPAMLVPKMRNEVPYGSGSPLDLRFTVLDCAGAAVADLPLDITLAQQQSGSFRVLAGRSTNEIGEVDVTVRPTGEVVGESPILRISSPHTAQVCEFRGEGL